MAEMAALLAISEALGSGKYDQIVVDTAPLGHTLRLFALPQYFSSFLDILNLAASRDRLLAEHVGGAVQDAPNALVAEWRGMVETGRAACLSNAESYLVTTSEKRSLNESRPSMVALSSLSAALGKGGVGKTTISAALGFNTRVRHGGAVDICSVDPAPSLDDIFQADITDKPRAVLGDRKFRASEMDAVAVFRDWAGGVKDMIDAATSAEISSVHVDLWFERQLFSQLLESVPPGLDEILAVTRVLDLVRERTSRVLIDMAPTGHALDLLRTPDRILVWTKLLL